jgi:predicted lipoprotein
MGGLSNGWSVESMKRKHIAYVAFLLALLLLLGSSMEFRRLETKLAEERAQRFDPAQYARDFWDQRLESVLVTAIHAGQMINLFNQDMQAAVSKGLTLGQSRVHAYLLKGEGTIVSLDKQGLSVSVAGPETIPEILVATGTYISGNAVRDASGLVDVSAFSDTMKFNRISFEINKIVVEEVIKPFLEQGPQVGMVIRFVGAAEVAEEAAQEVPFGGRLKDGESARVFHLLKVVPIRLYLQ